MSGEGSCLKILVGDFSNIFLLLFYYLFYSFFFNHGDFLGFRLRFLLKKRFLHLTRGVLFVWEGRAVVPVMARFPAMQAKV